MTALAIPDEHRRLLTTDEVTAMYRSGVLAPDEKVELIEGQLIHMAAKHRKHEFIKQRLARWLHRHLPLRYLAAVEPSLFLSESSFVDPDIVIVPEHMDSDTVRGPDALLVIEVADSSLKFDLEVKAPLYARHGVRHLWVIDAEIKLTHIHAAPSPDGYGQLRQAHADEAMALPFMPELSISLAELGA